MAGAVWGATTRVGGSVEGSGRESTLAGAVEVAEVVEGVRIVVVGLELDGLFAVVFLVAGTGKF